MALIEVTSSISQINPSTFFTDGFELSTQAIIPSEDYSGSFTQNLNNIEFYVYDAQKQVQYSDYNFSGFSITNNSNPNATPSGVQLEDDITGTTNIINLNPEQNTYDVGFTNGQLTAVYNFVNHELSSSVDNPYYLAEISGDRTEIRLKSNYISNSSIQSSFITFEQTLKQADYFDEFYISFGNNENHIGINTKLEINNDDVDIPKYSILIKLFDALPLKYKVGNEIYVVTKTAETQAFQINFEESINIPDDSIRLQGPNTNLNIKDFINNSSTYKNKNELINTKSTASRDELGNVLNRKGIHLQPNYSSASFNEFVNFSSAKSRVNNFYLKVQNIQTYENDIRLISATTGSNSSAVSSSMAALYTKVEDEIKNFDGFEYYQYYNTSSDAYPKDTSSGKTYPFELLDYDSNQVLTWLGSDDDLNQYYGGMLYSASYYDNNNENWLFYTIPTFITEQNNNDNYVEFCNLVGQSFDELWLYTKAVTEKLNTTNQLDKGVPLSLADDVITSLGYTGFGNNYNNQDNFIGLIGNDNGSYVPPTGSELITNYIAINKGTITNYWQDGYSWDDYVEQLITKGFPYPIDRVSKEIFKRLYHNMAYLVKKKGTVAGLRQLINIWGIPNTILRINEFGGKNKDETDDYDLWYQRYSYAYTPVANSYQASASAVMPWMPLQRNYIAETEYIVPDGVGFRFKTTGYPSSSYHGSFNSQSLAVKKSNGLDDNIFDWGIALFYTGSTSGSYSGSSNSDYRDYGQIKFYMSGAAADGGVAESDPIYLPFFDKGWWTVLLQRDKHSNVNTDSTTYTLYVKNKLYDGWDGNSIGFEGSASITNLDTSSGGVYGNDDFGTALYGGYISESINHGWNKYGTTIKDGVYVGGKLQGSRIGSTTGFITNEDGFGFSGSFQEFRYYSNAISESVFNDTVMNPESIEGNKITGSEASFDIINFRAPLGNELESFFTSSQLIAHTETIKSVHPAITASAPEYITGSFNDGTGNIINDYVINYQPNTIKRTYSKQNVETYFLDQPSIGIRNRISNKIQATSNLNFGTALSNVKSIQADPFISQSYTENINTLEVAFSPQDEINDDIIQTLGYGAIQSAIADPRFRTSSTYTYPQLDKIANDYFRKYVGSDIFDYLRLIKYFDDSLFKAIKNYVPARTSVSTGVVIKQNMLERNRYREPQVNSYSTQSYAINNIPLPQQNLEITGSIDLYEFSGSAGGSANEYNFLATQTGSMGFLSDIPNAIPAGGYLNLMPNAVTILEYGDFYIEYNGNSFANPPTMNNSTGLRSKKPISTQFSIHADGPITSVALIISSSLRGELFNLDKVWFGGGNTSSITPLIDIDPKETLNLFAYNSGDNIGIKTISNWVWKTYNPTIGPEDLESLATLPDISASISPNTQSYIENNITTLGIVPTIGNFQEEFYDGEYSGSALKTLITQSNPYKSILPSSELVNIPEIKPILTQANDLNGAGQWTAIDNENASFNTITGAGGVNTGFFTETVPFLIKPFQTYEISYDINLTQIYDYSAVVGLSMIQGGGVISSNFYGPQPSYAGATNGSEFSYVDGVLTPNAGLVGGNIGNTAVSFSFMYTPPETTGNAVPAGRNNALWDNLNFSYSLMLQADAGLIGTLNNFSITGVGGIYEEVQNAIPWDLNVINNYNPLTSGSFEILNTQSLVFENSDYNPLNNNVSQNRRSTNHYQVEYENQNTIENLQSIIDVMYNPFSASSPLGPLTAPVVDSNYTSLAALNPTYDGTKIKSLDYNFFTPSGSVRPVNTLPAQSFNRKNVNVSYSVATNFLDGSTGSWDGDDVNERKTAVIDKHPQYIAHFNRSFEQFNFYNSRDFTIDSLISISMDDLGGKEITPESIDIDGSNAYKKWVSSVFEPTRKVGVSFTTQNSTSTKVINLETLPVGNYDILGGSVQFLTMNGNAKSVSTNSNQYAYTIGGRTMGQTVDLSISTNNFNMLGLGPYNGGFIGGLSGSIVGADNIIESGSGLISNYNPLVGDQNTKQNYIILWNTNGSNIANHSKTNGAGTNAYISIDGVSLGSRSVTKITLYQDIWEDGFYDKVSSGVQPYGFLPGDIITIPNYVVNLNGYSGFVGDLVFRLPEENVLLEKTNKISQPNETIQMITASQVTDEGQQFGFLLSGSGTVQLNGPLDSNGDIPYDNTNNGGLSSAYYVPFSQNNGLSGDKDLPDNMKLSMSGPQLVLYHAYNQTVAKEMHRFPFTCPIDQTVYFNPLFVQEGIDAADPSNYYQWSPSGSDCDTYEDNQIPFLIERGDVLRIEGVKTVISASLTSSIDFIEDFTVEEVQDFYYSASYNEPTNGSFVPGSGPTNNYGGYTSITTNFNDLFQTSNGYGIGSYTSPPSAVQINSTQFTTSGIGTNGLINITPVSSDQKSFSGGIAYILEGTSFVFPGVSFGFNGAGYEVGDTITITSQTINSIFSNATQLQNVIITLTSEMLNTGGIGNPFSVAATLNPGCTNEYAYERNNTGDIPVSMPSFIKTFRNPGDVLQGLPGGAVTKFTIRKQVENDGKVMIKNTPPSLGSEGFLTQTGGGFLIPNDFTSIQKKNALNIINQLRQKNAFPGDTATDSGNNQTS